MIEAVVLWNEPNNLSHWDRDLDPSWELFAEMIRLAGARIRATAPGITRVLGGISPIDPRFMRHLLSLGVGRAVDAVAVHGFPLDWNRWHVDEWPRRVEVVRDAAGGLPVWVTEVGASSLASPEVQAWALDRTMEVLTPVAERIYWYALMDLPEEWEAVTRHRESEGSAYFRHFRMGLFDDRGRPKPAAGRAREWVHSGMGVAEWVYWREPARFLQVVRRLRDLGVRRLRTGIGWADWVRPGATEWFDFVMSELAEFEVSVTLCFTPAHLGVRPHHTSPPSDLGGFADFCEQVLTRYAPAREAGELVTGGAR